MATSVPGVFAAGGAIAPIQLAVRAVADGRAAAVSIGHFLSGSDSVADKPGFNFHASHKTDEELHARMPIGSPRQRISPAGGPASGFTAQEAQAEAARCLQCSCAGAATCKLRDLAQRCGASASRFRGERHAYSRDDSHPEVLFEAGKCIACGICVRLAAGFGQGFQGHGSQITVGGPFGAPIIESLGDAARACAQACPTGALTLKENECD